MGWNGGGGSIHSLVLAFDLGKGWGCWGTSPVTGKGNKGPLCPMGVGPCYHGHGQVH